MEDKNIDMDDLLIDYFSQNISEGNLKALNNWVHSSPENEKKFLDLQEIWFSSSIITEKSDFDKNEAYDRFLTRTGKKDKNNHLFITSRKLLRWTAAIALITIISYVSFQQGSQQLKNQFADIVIEAPWGSRTKTSLPDGTLVWLNAGSKISYSQGFGVENRLIDLSGEGYFEVTKNKKLPFSVKTEEMQVDVLGTKFNFCNYPDDEEATVSLLEGEVIATNHIKTGEFVKMLPDEEVFLNKRSGAMRVIKVDAHNTAEWINGFLSFDEELLPDIVKELERSYNVNITITHSDLEHLRFYGSFTRKELTIEEILDLLSSTNKIRYTINGKYIELSPP